MVTLVLIKTKLILKTKNINEASFYNNSRYLKKEDIKPGRKTNDTRVYQRFYINY